VSRPAKKNLRRISTYVVVIAGTLFGLGFFIYRRISVPQVVRLTEGELRQIQGNDLIWRPIPPTKALIDLGTLKKALGSQKYLSMGKTDADVLKVAKEIDATRATTDLVEKEIAGKQPEPAKISQDGDLNFGFGSTMMRLYGYQLRLALARKDRRAAIDCVRKAGEVGRFLSQYQAWPLYGGSLGSNLKAAVASPWLISNDLRAIYAQLTPAPRLDLALPSGLNFAFACDMAWIKLVDNDTFARSQSTSDSEGTTGSTAGPSSHVLSLDEPDMLAGQFDGVRTAREVAGLYREAKRNCLVPWRQQKWPEMDRYVKQVALIPEKPSMNDDDPELQKWWTKTRYRWTLGSVPNVLGLKELAANFGDAGPKIYVEASVSQRTRSEALRLLVALRIFELETGNVPSLLSDLDRLKLPGPPPLDLYADGPFHFDALRRVFWSVGPNGKDDGGRHDHGSGPADDMVNIVP
jgi:hypothetical protein